MKRNRMYLSLVDVGLVLLVILLVPLPHRVICTLEIQPRDAAPVYVTVPGELDEIQVKPGQRVAKDEPLARLENLDIDLEVADLGGQAGHHRQRLKNLGVQRHRDPQAGAQIPAIYKALQTVEGQLARKREDRQRLEIFAPAAGTVFPPPSMARPQQSEDQLGTLLDDENLGCYLDEGRLLCQVGHPARMEAVLVIDQADIKFIRKGQVVEINLDTLPQQTLTHNLVDGRKRKLTIEEVAKSGLKISPTRLSAKAATGTERPLNTSYQARVSLDDPNGQLLPGLCGQAKIKVGSQPLGTRLYRWLAQTISFKL